jgi:AcrR family transcriptional regulator
MDEAVAAIERGGISSVNLRRLARELGVSHAAPVHHFRDRAGLLTAIAVEGFERLTSMLEQTWEETGSFLELGVAYVRFATANPGHFDVMFRPDLHRRDDPALAEAKTRAATMLYGKVGHAAGTASRARGSTQAGIAAWALVHGLATLWLTGNLPDQGDPVSLARETASFLFQGTGLRRSR